MIFVSKECNIYHYWYFLDKVSKFRMCVRNGCHDLLMMSTNIDDDTILCINGIDYGYNTNGISKSGAVNLLQNADLKNYNFF